MKKRALTFVLLAVVSGVISSLSSSNIGALVLKTVSIVCFILFVITLITRKKIH